MRTTGIGERPRLTLNDTARDFTATVAGLSVGRVYQKGDGWHGVTPAGENGPCFVSREAAAEWLAEQELGR